MTMLSVGAFLIFGAWSRPNGAQSVTAIPFVDVAACERKMESTLAELIASQTARPITIKPYCTTLTPAWWVQP